MTDLIACISDNENALAHVKRLVNEQNWNNIFLVSNNPAVKKFDSLKEIELINIDIQKPVFALIDQIKNQLYGKISDLEVALNIVAGSGKEHMALISAIMKMGIGFRLIAVTKEGIREL